MLDLLELMFLLLLDSLTCDRRANTLFLECFLDAPFFSSTKRVNAVDKTQIFLSSVRILNFCVCLLLRAWWGKSGLWAGENVTNLTLTVTQQSRCCFNQTSFSWAWIPWNACGLLQQSLETVGVEGREMAPHPPRL